jgi:hypothetical protein
MARSAGAFVPALVACVSLALLGSRPALAQGIEPVVAARATAHPSQNLESFRLPLADLGLTKDALAYSDAASQSVHFKARADHVLTRAELDLRLVRPAGVAGFEAFDVLLNGELAAVIPVAQFATQPLHKRLSFDPSSLAGENTLSLRMRSARDAEGCGRVPAGSWNALQAADLWLESAALPLPDDLAQLPLPFFDPEFDREQVLHFVLGTELTSRDLEAAALVAAWFALQGRGRLSFEVHTHELPDDDAVVLLDSERAASQLALGPLKQESRASLELRPNPRAPERKLLVLRAGNATQLLAAAHGLLRDGYELSGARVEVASPVAPDALAYPSAPDAPASPSAPGALAQPSAPDALAYPSAPDALATDVPRWVTHGDVVLGQLPEPQPLRVRGGRSGTLRIGFRLPPDLFVWPSEQVELDLGYTQGISPDHGPARLHVAFNGASLGTLPSTAQGRVKLHVPRTELRGYNELYLHVSYVDPAANGGSTCSASDDPRAFVALTPDSRLRVGRARRFALLPDLRLFLYDGFPFTAHGDLRDTSIVLPADPRASELATMLDAFAHFAAITGQAWTHTQIELGEPDDSTLVGRDVLLIAAAGRHPLLRRWQAHSSVAFMGSRASLHYPERVSLLDRYLSGRFGQSELERAQRAAQGGALGVVFGFPAPFDASRSVVVLTGSDDAHMPRLSHLQGYAASSEPQNDVLLINASGRSLFWLGAERGRGQLPWLLGVRFWLAHDWPVLVVLLMASAALIASWARNRLAALARRRLSEQSV